MPALPPKADTAWTLKLPKSHSGSDASICPGASVRAPLERWQFTHSLRWAADMHRKTDRIHIAWATGDKIGALGIAARF